MILATLKVFYLQFGFLFFTMGNVGLIIDLKERNVYAPSVNRACNRTT